MTKMDDNKFKNLLKSPEGWELDFKSEQYKFNNANDAAKFIKDIISMANTVRNNTAYIFLGIKLNNDGSKTKIGIKKEDIVDDATLQEKIISNVYPVPKFLFYTFEYENLTFGIIEIPIVKGGGPYKPVKTQGGVLKENVIYHRSGSSNQRANNEEEVRIYKWFHNNDSFEKQDLIEIRKFIDEVIRWQQDMYLKIMCSEKIEPYNFKGIDCMRNLSVIEVKIKSYGNQELNKKFDEFASKRLSNDQIISFNELEEVKKLAIEIGQILKQYE